MMECKCDICGGWANNSDMTINDFKNNNWIFCALHRTEFLDAAFKLIRTMKAEREGDQ